ncbi:SMC family ATPase [Candidatus Babeliales bacterium]|nr:SMC family ATPase [Candidatus Babeliales bacterium]
MIPHQLQVKNFLSYGPELQTIVFGDHRLICLSGKNGHGKSALLDALTWAIWGQARKIGSASKADEGLLRLGHTHMMVIFDFSFHTTMYRIRREFRIARSKGYTNLEFGIIDQEMDQVIPLTEKTTRETQIKIENIIGLNFESFVNSAFLRQGQANEFSKKSPKERKDILASILGLEKFDLLKKAALEKIKHAYNEQKSLTKVIERIQNELNQTGALTDQHTRNKAMLETVERQATTLTKEHEQLSAQLEKINKQLHELSLQIYRDEQLQKEELQYWEQLQTLKTTWHQTRATTPVTSSLDQLMIDKKQVHDLLTQQHSRQEHAAQLHKQHATIVSQEHALATHLYAEHANARTHASREIERRATLLEALKQNLAELQQRVTKLTNDKTSLHTQREQVTKEQQSLPSLETMHTQEREYRNSQEQYNKQKMQLEALKQEHTMLLQKTGMALDSNNPSCPVCEQAVSAARKRFLQTRYNKEQHELEHNINTAIATTKHLEEIVLNNEATLKDTTTVRERHAAFASRQTELIKQVTQIDEELTELTHRKQELTDSIRTHTSHLEAAHKKLTMLDQDMPLERSDEYKKLLIQKKELEQNITENAIDQEQLKRLTHELQTIEKQISEHLTQAQRVAQHEQCKTRMSESIACLRKIKIERAELAHYRTIQQELTKQQTELCNHSEQLQQELRLLQGRTTQLLQERATLEHQQHARDSLKKDLNTYTATIKQHDETIDTYQILATAFGKDGIQALLIEEALPEIEHEANALLAKLTENQSQIIIESVRDLKKGGMKETLDIMISDPVGIRSYELFSGGEAFRIDFALRIAISKLLARRAGTSLQTLIIDEGFGSQDEEGLSHIMDALYKIQDDFEKIIIVSHLPSMKNQFPVHFTIEKGSRGSTVSVSYNG